MSDLRCWCGGAARDGYSHLLGEGLHCQPTARKEPPMSDLWVLDSTDDAADFRLLTPAEFADIARREGWVKLEDFDQEDVRKLMERSISRGCGCDPLARQVLAALDPEDTDV